MLGIGLCLATLAGATLGCGDDDADTGQGGSTTTGAGGGLTETSYHAHIRPLIERHCLRCHVTETFPELDSWEKIEPIADIVAGEVGSLRMPPYLPLGGCRDVAGLPLLEQAERDLFGAWAAAGFPEGRETDYVAPEPFPATGDLGAPTLELGIPTPFQLSSGEYENEWLIEPPFAEDTWVVASEIAPSSEPFIHHANAFVELGSMPPDVPAPTGILGAWAPGYAPLKFPTDSAFLIPAGARILLTAHYSTASVSGNLPLPTETLRLRLWTLPAGQRPVHQAFFDPIEASGDPIPAFAERTVFETEAALNFAGAPIVGVIPHMHRRGTEFFAEVRHQTGDVSCLVDVPRYDFSHQQLFLFQEPLAIQAGDTHFMRCVYDNSQENQPWINGMQSVSEEVAFGGNSNNEMCLDGVLRIVKLP